MRPLYFENRAEPVMVADGFGFKAPKEWGERVDEPVFIDDRSESERQASRKIDGLIDEAEALLASIIESNRQTLSELLREVRLLDVRIITASGVEYEAQLQTQRDLKLRQVEDIRAKTLTETAHQRERVAKLKELRSRKRKDLS